MLTEIQLNKMFEMQDAMNSKVNHNWKTANNDWLLAATMEAVEAIEHHGWKWWKHQERNVDQLQMELVDIWHFGMSHLIVSSKQENLGLRVLDSLKAPRTYVGTPLVQLLKSSVADYCEGVFFPIKFFQMVELSGMSYEDFYKKYVGKNLLNFFRQDHGYKDGSYIKVWNGEEDNIVLMRLLDTCDIESPTIDKELYEKLEQAYAKVTG